VSPYVALVVLGVTVLAQVTLMPAAALGDARPFLPLLLVVSWGLIRGPVAALGWALAAGAMLDAVSPTPFGYYLVAMLAVAAIVALGYNRLFASNMLLPALVVIGATLAFLVAQLAPLAISGRLVVWQAGDLATLAAKWALMSVVWLPIVYFPMRWLARWGEHPRIDWER
jgi:rod shape-determining protein MreD